MHFSVTSSTSIAAQPQAQIKEIKNALIATSDIEHKVSSYKSSSPIAAQPQAQIKEKECVLIATSDTGWLGDLGIFCKFSSAINWRGDQLYSRSIVWRSIVGDQLSAINCWRSIDRIPSIEP
jgi:hypothetical protein